MTQKTAASHYSGCGNDFLLLDDRQGSIGQLAPFIVQALCKEAKVDGLILVGSSKTADVAMKFYNLDGYEANMCGNGVRCLMKYLIEKCSYSNQKCLLETRNDQILLEISGSEVLVYIKKIDEIEYNISLSGYTLHYLDSGVPHLVIFIDDVEKVDVFTFGSFFRHHAHFQPHGANINFVQIQTPHPLIRTFERGVENETKACGTGVIAAAYALYKLHDAQSPITLKVRSGDLLTVCIDQNNVTLQGPAHWIRDLMVEIPVCL